MKYFKDRYDILYRVYPDNRWEFLMLRRRHIPWKLYSLKEFKYNWTKYYMHHDYRIFQEITEAQVFAELL